MISDQRGKAVVGDTNDNDCFDENIFSRALGAGNYEINIGKTFTCEEELYNAYNTYAISKGFGVRRGQKFYCKGGLSRGTLLCCCEGQSEVRGPHEEIQRERMTNRCGCEARLKYKVSNGVWEVVQFDDIHNHEMVEPNHRHFIPSARKLTSATRRIINSLVDSGVGPTKAFRYLANQAGGLQNVGCIEQDVHNHQQSRRKSLISGGDAQALIDYFSTKKLKDPNFFYTFQVDEDGRLCNVFWRDSFSKLHYECYGDVMIFDTTYRTNKWNMAFAPFVGLNNHWKNIYFGCAFLHDETSASFQWLFRSFLDSMGGKEPKTIFTDQDQAMANAIKIVLPNARHRLCEWHIEKNAAQKISHLFSQPDFKGKFNKLLWKCKCESEFDITWKEIVDECNVGENAWLNRLYNLREKWCPTFNKDIFSGDIRSTQRGESANRVFSDVSCQSTTLVEFANQFEKKVSYVRSSEALDDHRTRGNPKIQVRDCGILEDAAKTYTRTIFYRFQHEFLQCISDWIVVKTTVGHKESYRIQKEKSEESFVVDFDSEKCSIMCDCHMFETLGWLCCHALRILHINLGFKSVPEHYILKRWTKGAKQGVMFENDEFKKSSTFKSSATTRLNDLLMESFYVMSLAAVSEGTMRIARVHLNAARNELIQYQNMFFSCEDDGVLENDMKEKNIGSVIVKDPVNKRRKGQRNDRLKSCLENSKRPKKSSNKTPSFQSLASGTNVAMVDLNDELDEQLLASGTNMVMSGTNMVMVDLNDELDEQVELYDNQNVSFTQLLTQVNEDVCSQEERGNLMNKFQADN